MLMLNVNDNQSVKLLNVMDQLRCCFCLVFRLDFNGKHFGVSLNDTSDKKKFEEQNLNLKG